MPLDVNLCCDPRLDIRSGGIAILHLKISGGVCHYIMISHPRCQSSNTVIYLCRCNVRCWNSAAAAAECSWQLASNHALAGHTIYLLSMSMMKKRLLISDVSTPPFICKRNADCSLLQHSQPRAGIDSMLTARLARQHVCKGLCKQHWWLLSIIHTHTHIHTCLSLGNMCRPTTLTKLVCSRPEAIFMCHCINGTHIRDTASVSNADALPTAQGAAWPQVGRQTAGLQLPHTTHT
jgi:hypothetical protein